MFPSSMRGLPTFLIAPVKLIFPRDIIGLLVHTVSHGVALSSQSRWVVLSLAHKLKCVLCRRDLSVFCLFSCSLFLQSFLCSYPPFLIWSHVFLKEPSDVCGSAQPLSFSLLSDAPPLSLSLFPSSLSSFQPMPILLSLQKVFLLCKLYS